MALTTLLPPLTASIYYPVITELARELNVSITEINLTITVYLIIQGIAPSFVGNLSDETGRRPALLVSLLIFIAGSIGAAFRRNYALLLAMRCVQSAGSSGTIALSLATVSDIVTSAERGRYTSYVQMGWMLGPSLGPVIGGLLSQYLGVSSIFWFLAIYASIVWIVSAAFLPETCRRIVGNGSTPTSYWNMSLLEYLRRSKQDEISATHQSKPRTGPRGARLNPLKSLKLFREKETGLLLLYSGFIYASSYMVLSTFTDQLEEKYGFDTLHISLCFLASGFGTATSTLLTGRLLDWNFRRHAKLIGLEISTQKQQDLARFPIEVARLQISIPALVMCSVCLLGYTWTLQSGKHIAVTLMFLFFECFGSASSFSGFSNLVMDLNREKPGTASAAMNLARCWMGAGGTAFATPLVRSGGIGWLGVTIAGIWIMFSPVVFSAIKFGPQWREEERIRKADDNNSHQETPP
ncbi:major facilitator superfamily domain-containing protein [Truncatella angustata]|uniref:Major facilitator superfamily domain-containing protein n=1 Tax=Truncatella angustata TaxID=152316 RepID=A0A9P8UNT3_9PEZI|nr:major facilitator superfamily domain-containing protein [Truncatella angustata]KAH6655376.1 major facilitator superfamily domain-containing protein [Truncatella angustata]